MQKYAEKLLKDSGTDCTEIAAQWNSRSMMEALGDVPRAEWPQHIIVFDFLIYAKSLAY